MKEDPGFQFEGDLDQARITAMNIIASKYTDVDYFLGSNNKGKLNLGAKVYIEAIFFTNVKHNSYEQIILYFLIQTTVDKKIRIFVFLSYK